MSDCNDMCFCVSQHWPLAMPGEAQEYVGGNLEIWWCSKPERKYLERTKDFRTIIKTNNYIPPASRNRIMREHCPGVSSSKCQRRIGFGEVFKKSTKTADLRVGQRKNKVRTCRCLQMTMTIKMTKIWSKNQRTGKLLKLFSCKVSR